MGVQGSASKITCKVKHPVDAKRELHFLSDFPHLIKCLRNSLLKGGFNTPDGRARLFSPFVEMTLKSLGSDSPWPS